MARQTSNFTIETLLSENVELASPPEVFLKVSEIIDDPTKNAKDVGVIIENDPGLTARLLKIVNSAFFGFSSKITSLPHAITIVGAQEIRDLVLATLVVSRFSSHPNNLISMRDFWKSSVYIALLAKIMANLHPKSRQLGAVFTCGLLHNIGRLITYNRIPDLAKAALIAAESNRISEDEAERQIIGFDHYQVGAQLASIWLLPQVIIDSLTFHQEPGRSSHHTTETAIVAVCHHIVSMDALTLENAEQAISQYAAVWELTTLDISILETVVDETNIQFNEAFKLIF